MRAQCAAVPEWPISAALRKTDTPSSAFFAQPEPLMKHTPRLNSAFECP